MNINDQAPVTASHQIFIKASPAAVWKILTDVNSWTEWHPEISQASLDGKFAPSSAFKWKSGGFAIVSTLQEVAPPSHIAWTGKAFGAKAIHTFTLTSQDDGVVVQTAESFEGWLVWLLKGLMQKKLDSALRVWLESLKKKAEN